LTRIFRELGVTDRTQAALWAERHGEISTDVR
jgi:DNA-binding NarL/FixJ family response regulator